MSDNSDPKYPGSLPGGRDINDFVYDPAYAKPANDTRFKPGTSGNQRGRPIGSKNKPKFTDTLREELSRLVEVNDGKDGHLPIATSIIRNRLAAANAGNDKAQAWAMRAMKEVDAADAKVQEAAYSYAEKYRAKFEGKLFGSLVGGGDLKSPIPNPLTIVLNELDRTVIFDGPTNLEEHIASLMDYDDRQVDESVEQADDQKCDGDMDDDLKSSPPGESTPADSATITRRGPKTMGAK